MENTLRLLKFFVEQGFLLHGTSVRVPKLEPRQAADTGGHPQCCQFAVYATADIAIASVMAMKTKKNKRVRSWSAYYHREGNEVLRFGGKNVSFASGYIYILPAETFEEIDGELISRVSVEPIAVVQVQPEIITYLDIVLEC